MTAPDSELLLPGEAPLAVERRELFEPSTVDEWSIQITGSDRLSLRLEVKEDLLSAARAEWGLAAYRAVLDALIAGEDPALGALARGLDEPPRRSAG